MLIKFNKIVVNSIESHSGVLIGKNIVPGGSSIGKTQALNGTVKGTNNSFVNTFGAIIDNDVIDLPVRQIKKYCDYGQFDTSKMDTNYVIKRE